MTSPPPGNWSELVGPPRPVRTDATAELPAVPGPVAGSTPVGVPEPRHALIGRFTVSLGGLLAAGALVLGVGLLVLTIVVPSAGTGEYDFTTGPGWPRTVAHLAVGVLGEVTVQLTRRRGRVLRVTASVVVICAVLVVLALSWWR